MRVLVVDDEQDVRDMLGRLLSRAGYGVATAASGLDGLVAAQDDAPDLILLDIMMHPMDGWETLKLLKLDAKTRDVPVIIVSARAEAKDKIRALQEGATDYVTKPFSLRDLRDKIDAILQRPGDGGARAGDGA